MNAYANLVIDHHLENLRTEAAAQRSFRVERAGFLAQIATVAANARAALTIPAETVPSLPSLTDYPYRS